MSETKTAEETAVETQELPALAKSVQGMLNEEKWTRAAISNYTKNHFIELAGVIEQAQKENCADDVQKVCDNHLEHTKNSIVALYLSGILSLRKHNIDNNAMETLVGIFQDNRKTGIVVHLCQTTLEEDPTNKSALRTLALCYQEEGNEGLWETYEQLVRADQEEAEIAKLLAEHFEKLGNAEGAIDYYKKAILRFVDQKAMNSVKEVWTKLVSLMPEEIDFFYLVQRKIVQKFDSGSDKGTSGSERSAALILELVRHYNKKQDWNTAIELLKLALTLDEGNAAAREELVECFRQKYAGHSHLEQCIRESNLKKDYRNITEAIASFEKHIAFDEKNFVYHKAWEVGVITKVDDTKLTINFGKAVGSKEMALTLAVSALLPLSNDHIWVWKAKTDPKKFAKDEKYQDKLRDRVKNEIPWTLKTIIRSFGNNCDLKTIKAELVPSVLNAGEWTSWANKARKILETDATFGVNSEDITKCTVREHEVSTEEKLNNEFNAQKQFYARIDILLRFVEEADTDSELFRTMFAYFVNYLKAYNSVTDQVIASYLVIRRIITEKPHLDPQLPQGFEDLYRAIEDPREIYESLNHTKNTLLRADFLRCVRELLPDWIDQYLRLFPTVLSSDMLTTLINAQQVNRVKQLAIQCFDNYRENGEAAIYFFRECQEEDWFKSAAIPYEKQLITLIHILDQTFREISNHLRTAENRKINNQIQKLLFKDDTLLKYILEHDEDTITRLYTLVDDVKDLDPAIKMKMRNRILEHVPNFKFFGTTDEKAVAPQGLLVTSAMLEEKKQQLERITTVEIPENSREIGEALAQGDLRENAEYKAAKEKQGILSTTATKLQEEINRAQVFDPTTVTTVRVSFGTTVTLQDEIAGKSEKYTILGPWESSPDKDIISYMSPFGNAILNAKEGEVVDFVINERKCKYRVEKITPAKF